jgi:hypothetical protein
VTATATRDSLRGIAAPIRRLSRVGQAALAAGGAALVLAAAVWIVRLGWLDAPWWVLAAWGIALPTGALLLWRARSRDRSFADEPIARRLEATGGWRRGALVALLEPAAAGTSEPLHQAADRALAGDLAARGRGAVEPLAKRVRREAAAGGLCLGAGLVALAAAGPATAPADALWHPARAWELTTAPVRLTATDTLVDRGAAATLVVEAPGRREATLWLRAPGEEWRSRSVALDSVGRARVDVGPLATELFARASAGRRGSQTVTVRVRVPAFLGAVEVTAHYPAYLGLETEPVPMTGDTIVLPAGTRLAVRGEATARLASAEWVADRGRARLDVTGRSFSGRFVPRASGAYRLTLVAADGGVLAGDPVVLPIRVVPDAAPVVDIPVPGADTLAPLDLRVPLVVDARDDYGLRGVVLETRRISRLGLADPVRREAVPLPGERPDHAIATLTLDLNGRGLLPGDTIRYRAVAVDDSPGRQAGRSREYVLRLPTLSEVRAAQRQASQAIGRRLDSLAERSRRVERETEDLARTQRTPQEGRRNGPDESLSYDEAQRAQATAGEQQAMMQEAEELKAAIEALQEAAEAAGAGDSAWRDRLQEIQEQLDRALSPELRQKLAELQEALKNLDASEAKEALHDLAAAQEELRQALERSRELFRRAAVEGDLANLKAEARDLSEEQRQWSDQVPTADSARAAAAEQMLAERADSLAAALDRVGEDAAREGQQERLEQLGEQARQAGGQMQQASRSAQQGRRRQAQQQGEQAAAQLQPLEEAIEQAGADLAQEWRDEVMEALDQVLAETSRLSERELELQQKFEQGSTPAEETRAEQGAVEEGVKKLLEELREAGGKNALVPQQISGALAQAGQEMMKAREAVSTSNPNNREAGDRAGGAVDALNAATYQLLRARGDVSGSASGSGLAEAMEQMQALAQQQGGIGQQTGGLLPMAGQGAIREQLRALGAQQRRMAEELERMRAQGQMPGAGSLADEAREVARRLEAGRLDRQTVERQERLFRRMLDAGRTLQGEERDDQKERQSTAAKEGDVRLPPALRARLGDDGDRPRLPSWDELQRLSPGERRLVLDYFRRLRGGE